MATLFKNLGVIPVCRRDKIPPRIMAKEDFFRAYPMEVGHFEKNYIPGVKIGAVVCPRCNSGYFGVATLQLDAYEKALTDWYRENK